MIRANILELCKYDEAGEDKSPSRDGLTSKSRGNCLLLANEQSHLSKRKKWEVRRLRGLSARGNMISGNSSLRITDPNRRRGGSNIFMVVGLTFCVLRGISFRHDDFFETSKKIMSL